MTSTDDTGGRPTYRERRMARADRLEGWAEGREAKAAAAQERARAISDMIPFGQPILVGHHSEGRHRRDLARMTGGMDKAAEHAQKAREMSSRAENIRAAADRAIYSDDPDAVERLTAKLAELEAKREHIKQANAAFRKEHRAELKGMTAYQRDRAQPFPSYVGQNLSGVISTTRKRLAEMTR